MAPPRYYGFKNVKWTGEMAFVGEPDCGEWTRIGSPKEPLIHTVSFIDLYVGEPGKFRTGGVSFAGSRGIPAAELRAGGVRWTPDVIVPPLPPHTWSRWLGILAAEGDTTELEARAMDGPGRSQEARENPLFPAGVLGTAIRRLL